MQIHFSLKLPYFSLVAVRLRLQPAVSSPLAQKRCMSCFSDHKLQTGLVVDLSDTKGSLEMGLETPAPA